MDSDILINKLRVIINHLPLMSDKRQVIAIGSANCMLDAYFLSGGKFIKTRADECMPPNQVNAPDKLVIPALERTMTRIEECENLWKEWKTKRNKALNAGDDKQSLICSKVHKGIDLALTIFKRPSNTQMHVDTNPCECEEDIQDINKWNFCPMCGGKI